MSQPNGEITTPATSADVSATTPNPPRPGATGAHMSIGAEFHVIGLLTQLYTAGEMPTPSPLTTLGARTMHSLYAGSFIVYSINLACDWLHTYAACQGWTVSFPLRPWVVIMMVCSCFAGSVLLFLLFYLCIENALIRRYDLEPFRGGFWMIVDKLGSWMTAFSCFRVAFLVLVLEDLPMSFANLWLLSACRLCSSHKMFWPLLFSSFSSLLSLVWRAIMLYYSYKHYWFFGTPHNKWSSQSPGAQAEKRVTKIDRIKEMIGLGTERMWQYDECWPVRMGVWNGCYKERGTSWIRVALHETPNNNFISTQTTELDPDYATPPKSSCSYIAKAMTCCCLSSFLYLGMCLIGCLPCCYHYTCKRNARFHRNRFSRTCTRMCTNSFHATIIVFSVITTASLLLINAVYVSSIQLIGINHLPPEISHMCVELNLERRKIHASIRPYATPFFNHTHFFECKPIFELHNGAMGFQWQKVGPKPWKRVIQLNALERLIFWLDVDLNSDHEKPVLHVDFVLERMTRCLQLQQSGWSVDSEFRPLGMPYFLGCFSNYQVVAADRLSCAESNSDDSPVFLVTRPTIPVWPLNLPPITHSPQFSPVPNLP